MKKILTIGIFIILILSGAGALALSNNFISFPLNDEIDQSQTYQDDFIYVDSYIHLAQSFVPTLNMLTRVELLLTKDPDFPPTLPFQLAIRYSLTGDNLAYSIINPAQVPTFPNANWIEFDFNDIQVTTGETYYIVVYSDDNEGYLWGEATTNPYPDGMIEYSIDGGITWDSFTNLDGCFKTYGYNEKRADLECEGSISWIDIEPSATVSGKFTVQNVGEPESLLDWEVESYPDWGTWEFIPGSLTHQTPEDGPFTVHVEVKSPGEFNSDFEGEIIIVNSDNHYDFCIIDVSLSTPIIYNNQMILIQKLLSRFPNLFPIFRLMLKI